MPGSIQFRESPRESIIVRCRGLANNYLPTEAAVSVPSRMPAEWEPHRATWIAWPHHAPDWPGKFAAIPWVYTEIVRHLVRSETVCILVDDAKMELRVKRVLRKAGAP